ncbi:5154_t:CDS:2, partial [Gigaspora rosea]
RPTLNEILDQLENLSGETTANFIMNNNVISYQQIVLSRLKRSMIKNLEGYGSFEPGCGLFNPA